MKFEISAHVLEESNRRGIPLDMLKSVLKNPGQIVDEYGGKKAYQSQIPFESGKIYLVRVVVKQFTDHVVAVTVYKTSKIDKYWRVK